MVNIVATIGSIFLIMFVGPYWTFSFTRLFDYLISRLSLARLIDKAFEVTRVTRATQNSLKLKSKRIHVQICTCMYVHIYCDLRRYKNDVKYFKIFR